MATFDFLSLAAILPILIPHLAKLLKTVCQICPIDINNWTLIYACSGNQTYHRKINQSHLVQIIYKCWFKPTTEQTNKAEGNLNNQVAVAC